MPSSNEVPSAEHARWFVEQVKPHEPSLRSYLHGAFPKVHDVDDVVQESYLRIWRRKNDQPIKSAKAFLFTIARRLALDLVRRERRSPTGTVADIGGLNVLDDKAAVTEIISQKEKVRLLVDAIDALPARCREVVVLRKLNLVPQKEVAARLGISERGVELQLNRGLTRCREFFQARGIHDLFQS